MIKIHDRMASNRFDSVGITSKVPVGRFVNKLFERSLTMRVNINIIY